MKLNTLDLDFKCQYLRSIETKLSSSKKGVHITLLCERDCEFCRFLYDDLNRFEKDKNRPEYGKNVLFSKKTLVSIRDELMKPETPEHYLKRHIRILMNFLKGLVID